MYLADLDNRRIRAIDMKTAPSRTVAGNGQKGVPKDGADARQGAARRSARRGGGRRGQRLHLGARAATLCAWWTRKGKIRTVAGTGKAGATGDGGDARKATLNGPKHLCIDGDGNVIIADTENHLIRKYLPKDGKIVRVAGSGKKGTAGLGGPPGEGGAESAARRHGQQGRDAVHRGQQQQSRAEDRVGEVPASSGR